MTFREPVAPWEWGRAWRSGLWHRVRLYRDGIAVFRCVGYREHSPVEDGAGRLPRGAKVCRRCANTAFSPSPTEEGSK